MASRPTPGALARRGRVGGCLATIALALGACGGDGDGSPRFSQVTVSAQDRSVLERRPAIGAGPRFQPGPGSGAPPGVACRRTLGPRFAVHVELFARRTVILLAPGIGTRPPRRVEGAYVRAARCYGPIVTLDPTGVVLVSPGTRRTLGDLFEAWGQPLGRDRLLSFSAAPGRRVRADVGGRRWDGDPAAIVLRRHAQIVVQVGALVTPHRRYRFAEQPPGSVAPAAGS